jgi:hypothetical protein
VRPAASLSPSLPCMHAQTTSSQGSLEFRIHACLFVLSRASKFITWCRQSRIQRERDDERNEPFGVHRSVKAMLSSLPQGLMEGSERQEKRKKERKGDIKGERYQPNNLGRGLERDSEAGRNVRLPLRKGA